MSKDLLLAVLFVTDFIVCGVNVYCLLCVASQYQEYAAGRGRPEDRSRMEPEPEVRCLRFHWPSFQALDRPPPEPLEGGPKDCLAVPAHAPCHRSNDSVGSSARLIGGESCSGRAS